MFSIDIVHHHNGCYYTRGKCSCQGVLLDKTFLRFGVQGSGFKVQGSRFKVQGCGGGFAASIYGAMPEGLRVAGFPRIVSLPRVGKATIREYRFPHNAKANTRICGKSITTDKAFPSRGRCLEGADRALAAGKTDEESGEVRGTYGESVSPLAKISHFARNNATGI